MPEQYDRDWLKVAAEEAYHFTLLNDHLNPTAISRPTLSTARQGCMARSILKPEGPRDLTRKSY
jgi:hypothetical protein